MAGALQMQQHADAATDKRAVDPDVLQVFADGRVYSVEWTLV